MDKIQLNAKARDIKHNLKKLRDSGELPAVLYGHNLPNLHLQVSGRDFDKVFKRAGESTIVELLTDDGKTHPVLIHDVHNHYLSSKPIHVDFYEVSMSEKLKAKVALEFSGEARAVKELGGVLVKNISEVEVECFPTDLPHNLPVDVSALNSFEDVILVRDLKVSGKVQILTHAEELVAKVQPPRDVEAELAVPVVEDISVVEGAAETPTATAEGEGEAADSGKTEGKKPAEKKAEKE